MYLIETTRGDREIQEGQPIIRCQPPICDYEHRSNESGVTAKWTMGTDWLEVFTYRLDEEFGFELPEEDEPKLLDQCARTISRGLFTIVTLALCTGMKEG